jgi:hypothetical protein
MRFGGVLVSGNLRSRSASIVKYTQFRLQPRLALLQMSQMWDCGGICAEQDLGEVGFYEGT